MPLSFVSECNNKMWHTPMPLICVYFSSMQFGASTTIPLRSTMSETKELRNSGLIPLEVSFLISWSVLYLFYFFVMFHPLQLKDADIPEHEMSRTRYGRGLSLFTLQALMLNSDYFVQLFTLAFEYQIWVWSGYGPELHCTRKRMITNTASTVIFK